MLRWSSPLSSLLISAAITAACLLAFAPAAHAGPVEALVQVALHPKNPDVMVLRHEFGGEGIFITKDRGKTWAYVCNAFIDPTTQARRGVLQVAGDGALLLGVFDGVWRGDAGGCNWGLDEALATKWVPDIAQDPGDPDVLYAITSNGNPGSMNGIVRRDATGAWKELGLQEDLLLTRMRVAKNGDGRRFYQSAVKGTRMVDGNPMPVPNYVIRYSDDDGASYTLHEFASTELSASFRLVAVDPTNPDRIVAWIDRDVSTGMQDSLMVSSNRGETFSEYMKVSDFGGIALAPDGRVWVAERGSNSDPDATRGLWAAANLDTEPTQLIDDLQLSCLAYQPDGDTLYACQLRKFGSIDTSSGTFSDLFLFNKVENFATCAGSSMPMSQVCESQMCRDYCALGHFPETPMCAVFQTPTCGPCAAIPKADGCMLTATGGAGGGGGASGGGAAGSGMSSAGSSGSAGSAGTPTQPSAGAGSGSMSPDAGTTGDDGDGDGGGGCAVAANGGGELGAFALAMLGAALGLARRRASRVRRRARPRT